jgi:hypothetical protein
VLSSVTQGLRLGDRSKPLWRESRPQCTTGSSVSGRLAEGARVAVTVLPLGASLCAPQRRPVTDRRAVYGLSRGRAGAALAMVAIGVAAPDQLQLEVTGHFEQR